MRLFILEDFDKVSYYIADYIKKRILQFKPTSSRPFVLGLPCGSSPIGVYRYLIEFYRTGQLSFQHVVTFNMDEYVGLPKEHPESYHTFMWIHLFRHIDIPVENVNILNGNATNLDEECQRYEDKIRSVGGIELFMGGIGPDGHIGFNEPGSSLHSRTRPKTLTYETILANARFFDGDMVKVPKLALTVGIATFMSAREVCLIITGQHKAVALAKCIEECVNHAWAVSCIQLHPSALVVCDEDATQELHVKTVNYFNSIQQIQQKVIGPENIDLKGSVINFHPNWLNRIRY
ncbi:Glucosamine-6-phosphate isomerase (Glucosamine-6-phosphate deaminase) (GNPDA) (GlcN6P deaminase) [Basidiobolus ranarum]|uniref:Glucosamine-6-phosphate isomerase n=1 Tax=Basidiobolus ranarum TaxID=34480 RepID=A0ABR2WAD3_9FUNG